MDERLYEVWARIGDWSDCYASNMTLDHAMLFVEAWLVKYYNETETGLEIRQMMRCEMSQERDNDG